jgi:integrase
MSTAASSSLPASSTSARLARWRQARAALMIPRKAANTEASYALAWNAFRRWSDENGLEPLPASFDALSLYLTHLLGGEHRLSTVRVKLAAIADRHTAAGYPSPVNPIMRTMLSNAARERRERPRAKLALTTDQARAIARLNCGRPKDQRDRTLVLVGFSTGWRRSELSSLDLAHVRFVEREGVILSLGASKTDQKGAGRQVSIPYSADPATCAVANLARWIEMRGDWRGPLFSPVTRQGYIGRSRLGGWAICHIVKDLLRRIGVDPQAYGAHSLRSGMVTAAYLNGAREKEIMASTGHVAIESVLRYVQPLKGFRDFPLKGVL